ncbi:Cysteine desulfurase [Candidatus Gugararchaeum adminiculabundum]|nr:Cysteine desulfurase [Candidatus Gugararchaeum adminiculabundum]
MFDAKKIRKDFPALQKKVHGKPLAFLDSAASSQRPTQVLDAMRAYFEEYNANVHRGIYEYSEMATQKYEGARRKIAKFINSPSEKEIIFTKNCTEAINLVSNSWGRSNIHKGDTILLSQMEHHSNLVPWQMLAKEKSARLEFIPLGDDFKLDLHEYEKLLHRHSPKIVSFTGVSNVLGTITPAKQIVKMAHDSGAVAMVDGAQSVPHLPTDVQQLGADFLAFSGHKMLGPTGIGVLHGKAEILNSMPPFLGGGDMIKNVEFREATYADIPYKFEAGTPPIAEVIGLGAAVDYLHKLGMQHVREHEKKLVRYALEKFDGLSGITLYGTRDLSSRGGVFSFNLKGIHPHDLASILDQEGVAIRAGHLCAQPLVQKLGAVATARASFYVYTLEEEIDQLALGFQKAQKAFGV